MAIIGWRRWKDWLGPPSSQPGWHQGVLPPVQHLEPEDNVWWASLVLCDLQTREKQLHQSTACHMLSHHTLSNHDLQCNVASIGLDNILWSNSQQNIHTKYFGNKCVLVGSLLGPITHLICIFWNILSLLYRGRMWLQYIWKWLYFSNNEALLLFGYQLFNSPIFWTMFVWNNIYCIFMQRIRLS